MLPYVSFHEVTTAKCSSCREETVYNGAKDAVLNMGICIVSYDLLRTYLHLFLNGRLLLCVAWLHTCTKIFTGIFRFPLHSYHRMLVGKHKDSGDKLFDAVFLYYMLRASWYKYLSLLDIDFGVGFRCPKCFAQPDIVICDATSLAFRRSMLKSHKPIEDANEVLDGRYRVCAQQRISVTVIVCVCCFSSFKDRVFIEEAECRRLLRRYSETAEDDDSLRYFSDAYAKKLLDCL